jgi:hypothetical protein
MDLADVAVASFFDFSNDRPNSSPDLNYHYFPRLVLLDSLCQARPPRSTTPPIEQAFGQEYEEHRKWKNKAVSVPQISVPSVEPHLGAPNLR